MILSLSISPEEMPYYEKKRLCAREYYRDLAGAYLSDLGIQLSEKTVIAKMAGGSFSESMIYAEYFFGDDFPPPKPIPLTVHRRFMSELGIKGDKLLEMDFYFFWATGSIARLEINTAKGNRILKMLCKGADVEYDKFRL